jgi:PAS domain-containing protein
LVQAVFTRFASRRKVTDIGIIEDVTEARLVHEELAQSRDFLDRLLEAIPAPVFYKDAAARYTGCNSAYENFYSISRNQLTGKSVFDISPPELARLYHERDAELLAIRNGDLRINYRFRGEDVMSYFTNQHSTTPGAISPGLSG